jgi:putative hydrolase of the HAD superfamily
MILIFDLDDTLYDERTYVNSGLKAVAKYGQEKFGWDAAASYKYMKEVLEKDGRGQVFDSWLAANGKISRSLVMKCVKVYRHHNPELHISPQIQNLLVKLFPKYQLYLVTDGHKVVQQKKVEALNISKFFRKVMITHRYGIRNSKPSIYCFYRIREMEQCEWNEMVYIGDNPAKDFVNLNPLGITTVRVKTGMYRNVIAEPGYDAQISIENIGLLPETIGL